MLFVIWFALMISCDSAHIKPEEIYKLDIIHYNDFHARFEETSLANSICRTNNNLCLGGFPRLYHMIKKLLREKPNAILLNAGDNFQGTYWFTTLRGSITDVFLNMLPHDAHAIGNHEFDDGPAKLGEFLGKLKAPVLVANMDTSEEPSLQGKYKPSIVVERKGKKIGIIGLITVDTKVFLDIGKVKFTDTGEALRREALALKGKGVDIVVVLSHCGLNVDRELARNYGGYIDVIVGGHTHSLLWNRKAPTGEPIAGPYPVVLEGKDKNKVLIVQTSAFTKYMGNLTVYFDKHGKYIKHEGDAIFLDRSIPEDLEVKQKLQPYALKVHEAEQVIVGDNLNTLIFEDCSFGECGLGDLLTDSMVEYAKEHYNSKLDYIAVNQRGNIRSNIVKGKITKGVLFELLPYSDQIQHFELKGKLIREALEKSVSEASSLDPFTGPWVLQLSGLQVTYNVALPEGKRVTSVFVGGKGSTTPLVDDQSYHVLGPRFWLGYPERLEEIFNIYPMCPQHVDIDEHYTFIKMLRDKNNPQDIGKDLDILEAYVKKYTPLNINTDGRIVIRTK